MKVPYKEWLHDVIADEIKQSFGIIARNQIDADRWCPRCSKAEDMFFQTTESLGIEDNKRWLVGWYYCPHCGKLERGSYRIGELYTGSIDGSDRPQLK